MASNHLQYIICILSIALIIHFLGLYNMRKYNIGGSICQRTEDRSPYITFSKYHKSPCIFIISPELEIRVINWSVSM